MIILISVSDYSNTILIQQRVIMNTATFNQSWEAYKVGFNDIDGNLWIGNEIMHNLTKDGNYQLRVELQDTYTSTWYCYLYDQFIVDNETSGYKLHIGGYRGPPGQNLLANYNGRPFATFDSNNNQMSRVVLGGFWYYTGGHIVVNGGNNHFFWAGLSTTIVLKTSRLLLQQRARQ